MRARALALAVVAVVGAIATATGCSLVAGVSFNDAHEATVDGAAGTNDDGGVGSVPDPDAGGCAPDQKTCNGACVAKADPNYGCGGPDCLPCSIPFGKAVTCRGGVCAPDGCTTGRDDCDKDPANGCEADLTRPTTCGSCDTVCPTSAPLCAPQGCVSTCPGNLTQCNGSCVDTTSSTANCGVCGKICNAPTNGDPACISGTCAFSCHAGFGDCVNNPAQACNALPKWFADGDGDGVGSASSVAACAPPAGYVATSGDCLDTNPNVFPGQPAFFGASYTNGAGVASWDYDCSGVEVEQGTPEHWPGGACTATCDQLGYLPLAGRLAGAGVDTYCGSTVYRECIDTSIALVPMSMGVTPRPQQLPIGTCRSSSVILAPIACH